MLVPDQLVNLGRTKIKSGRPEMLMPSWISNNYTWVFSGIGVLVLSIVFRLFRRNKPNRQSSASITDSTVVGPIAGRDVVQTFHINNAASTEIPQRLYDTKPDATRPDPNEIVRQIDSLPLFQQSAASESYVGIKVRWPMKIKVLNDPEQGKVPVWMHYGDKITGATVRAFFSLADHPRIKTVYAGQAVIVTGTIARIDIGQIHLDDAELEFVD